MSRSFCAFLMLAVQLCVLPGYGTGQPAGAQGTPLAAPVVCGKSSNVIADAVDAWIAAAEKCVLGELCEDQRHNSQYTDIRAACDKPTTNEQRKTLESMLPAITEAMAAMEKLYDSSKEDIGKLDQEFDRQLHGIWTTLQKLQEEQLYGFIGSGRVEKALFYQSIVGNAGTDLSNQFVPSNVEELLLYAWNLQHWSTIQKNVYGAIEGILKSSGDPLLQAAYTVDRAKANVTESKRKDEAFTENMVRLRANLTSGHFDTLLELARRYPTRYAYLMQHLAEFFGDTKPNPAELLTIVSDLPRQLPTTDERLLTLKAITELYLADNATITDDPGFLYPMSRLAHEIASLFDEEGQSTADGVGQLKQVSSSVADMFNTPISGRSAEYFSRSLLSKVPTDVTTG
uniref:TRIO salivary gland protein n=1 Tax=Anopheles atroparvus TaxID=41427 RepID=A0A182JMI7_ANOAO